MFLLNDNLFLWLEKFNYQPDTFEFQDFIKEIENISPSISIENNCSGEDNTSSS